MYRFHKDFMWGGASSGPQSEGRSDGDGKADSIWDYWFQKEPERFFEGTGLEDASGFYSNYKEIIACMKTAGIKSYRTSIQWSRIFSDAGGTKNLQGITFYHKIIDELISQEIEPILCLYHFDMPMYWMEKGGFEHRDTVKAFAEFAEFCFREYGDKVKLWQTFNEPIVVVEGGYLYGFHYPATCDAKRAAVVGFHLQLASSSAVERFRRVNIPGGRIGIVLNLTPSYCKDSEDEMDCKAARVTELVFNRSFLDPSVKGYYPNELIDLLKKEGICPAADEDDLKLIRENTVDYLGVNYYQPRRVKARTTPFRGPLSPEKYYEAYSYEGQKMNHSRGWEIYEPALYDIAIRIKEEYGNIPWYVSENGMGVQDEQEFMNENGEVQDDYRIEFIKEHLKWLHKGIGEGSNCFGYHLWSPFDCWSWTNAYKNRYGLIRVDIHDKGTLSMKKSGRWFQELTRNGGF